MRTALSVLLAVAATARSASGFGDNPFFYQHWCPAPCAKLFPSTWIQYYSRRI